MNAFNRLIMLLIALLLVVVPVLLVLVALGVIPPDTADSYTNYRNGLTALGDLVSSNFDFDQGVRVIIAVVGAIVAIVALLLLIREAFGPLLGRQAAGSTLIDDTPGAETKITAKAVRVLAESAAREAGAASSSASLTSDGRPYVVYCDIWAPQSSNFTELANRTRENIRRALENQSVPVKDIEVTVRGTVS